MTNQRLAAIAVALAAASFLAGRLTAPHELVDGLSARGRKIATYSGGSVGADDVGDVLPEGRGIEHARSAVEALVRVRLLARQAEKAGLHQSPGFLARYTEELAGLYVAETFEKPFQNKIASEEEIRKFFDDNKVRLSRPERVRLAHIALYAPKSDAAKRARKGADALKLLAQARQLRGDEYAFGLIAMTRSDDEQSRAVSGELPFLSRDEVAARLGPEAVYPAFAGKPGEVLEGIIETDQGFHVVKVLAREDAREARYEELRDSIKARLTAERHEKAFKEFADRLWADANVKVDEKALEQVLAERAKKGVTQASERGAGKQH